MDMEIKELVAEILEMQADTLDEEASFVKDLGMDSLRALEILAALENRYQIQIPPEKLVEMKTLRGVINVAKNCRAGECA